MRKRRRPLGKLSVEIVGKEHDMNYKKVMRYIRLNSLVPELLDKVDTKQMGFMPAVEISYIRPENQRLIAVSIDGEQSSPSVAQAKRLHELDKEGKLNGDVIDGILSEEKKEDRGVIISTAELSKYFGKEGHSCQNERADHGAAGRVERETAARTGAAGQEKGLGEVTGPRFWTLCPEVNAPRRGWALW